MAKKTKAEAREAVVLVLIQIGALRDEEIFDDAILDWMTDGGELPARLVQVLGARYSAALGSAAA